MPKLHSERQREIIPDIMKIRQVHLIVLYDSAEETGGSVKQQSFPLGDKAARYNADR